MRLHRLVSPPPEASGRLPEVQEARREVPAHPAREELRAAVRGAEPDLDAVGEAEPGPWSLARAAADQAWGLLPEPSALVEAAHHGSMLHAPPVPAPRPVCHGSATEPCRRWGGRLALHATANRPPAAAAQRVSAPVES